MLFKMLSFLSLSQHKHQRKIRQVYLLSSLEEQAKVEGAPQFGSVNVFRKSPLGQYCEGGKGSLPGVRVPFLGSGSRQDSVIFRVSWG